MTAPALVVVAHGSQDPRVAQVTHELRKGLQSARPELTVHGAFLDHCSPSGSQVVAQLARQGVPEVVFVPLQLSNAIDVDPTIDQLVCRSRAAHPELRFATSRPIGPEISLLTVLDHRMRAALSHARCLELDGLVLSAESAGDVRGSALLARRARQWSTHHRLPCLTAVADESGPSVAQAIMGLRAQGRRHIAVGSFFLSADEAYHAQADLAYRFGAVSVSEPIGAASEVVDLVLARYAFAAMDLLDFGAADELDAEPSAPHLTVVGA
ncbi:MAG: CbiX/SirB N-terminal domain-containing protein [Propionicimonas sp.]|uniref:sirohydrochlorin chelatase n=1 Tax=Propionicimonas sp. TaxID=1955623 RepID=UPI002B1F0E4A|nr:CbiX/SirB N-terminal domain-containing protein [Propionicimonas sp.]MEA4943638.1 CbiX/SirB N-terminal domain-containing protein [Propionicimonas sp.]